MTAPTCIAQGPDGALYIGTLALVDSLVFGPSAIAFPAGVAVGPDDGVYVSNGTAFVPQGQVVRLTNH